MRATTDRREPWELVIMIEWSITVRQALLVDKLCSALSSISI